MRYKTADGWSRHAHSGAALQEIRDAFLNSSAKKYPVDWNERPKAESKLHPDGHKSTNAIFKNGDDASASAKSNALAYILILMVEDLDAKDDFVVEAQSQPQRHAIAKLKTVLPHVESIVDINSLTIKYPKLRTGFREASDEPYNRALVLLRYAQEMFSKVQWTRLKNMSPTLSKTYVTSNVPRWMQSQSSKNGDNAPKQSERSMPTRRTNPQGQKRSADIVDLTDSPEPDKVDLAFKEEPTDGEQRLEPESQLQHEPRPESVESIAGSRTVVRTAAAQPKPLETNSKDQVEEDDIEEDLQWQLNEAELELKAMRLRKQIAARKKAKTANV